MDTITEIIIALLGALTGGGLTGLFFWKASRRKAEGEATQTEADALKSIQDVYQQTLEDQQKYISQLRETRDHLFDDKEELRKENIDLRQQLNEMGDRLRKLENSLNHYARMVESTRLWMCGRMKCQQRLAADFGRVEDPVLVSTDVVEEKGKKNE